MPYESGVPISEKRTLSFKELALAAFKDTYSGVGDDYRAIFPVNKAFYKHERFFSIVSAFIGTPGKYQDPPSRLHFQSDYKLLDDGSYEFLGDMIKENRNLYDRLEQVIFLVPRIAKNTLKLFTEFLPNLLARGARNLAFILMNAKAKEQAGSKRSSLKKSLINAFLNFAILICAVSRLAFWIIGTIGQSITSPITAMKQSFNDPLDFFDRNSAARRFIRRNPAAPRFIRLMLAGVRGLITLSAYTAAVLFLAPIVAPALAATEVGANIVAGISAAASWIANAPVLSAIGSSVVSGLTTLASSFGLTLPAGLISVGLAAGVTLGAPILAGLRALAQKFSPDVPSCFSSCCGGSTKRIANANGILLSPKNDSEADDVVGPEGKVEIDDKPVEKKLNSEDVVRPDPNVTVNKLG